MIIRLGEADIQRASRELPALTEIQVVVDIVLVGMAAVIGPSLVAEIGGIGSILLRRNGYGIHRRISRPGRSDRGPEIDERKTVDIIFQIGIGMQRLIMRDRMTEP